MTVTPVGTDHCTVADTLSFPFRPQPNSVCATAIMQFIINVPLESEAETVVISVIF